MQIKVRNKMRRVREQYFLNAVFIEIHDNPKGPTNNSSSMMKSKFKHFVLETYRHSQSQNNEYQACILEEGLNVTISPVIASSPSSPTKARSATTLTKSCWEEHLILLTCGNSTAAVKDIIMMAAVVAALLQHFMKHQPTAFFFVYRAY